MNIYFAGVLSTKEQKEEVSKTLLSYFCVDQVKKYIKERKEKDENKNR